MTAKQRAMSERTQAFQQAMSAITAGGEGTGNVEKTLEAFARAQAEQELREAAEKRAREAARSSRGKGKGRKTIAGGDIKSAEHITTNSAPRELSFD